MFGYSGNGAADITLFHRDSGGSLLQTAISMDFRLGGRPNWAFQTPTLRPFSLAMPQQTIYHDTVGTSVIGLS